MGTDWIPVATKMPQKGERIDWISPSGQQVHGGKYGGGIVWWLPGW